MKIIVYVITVGLLTGCASLPPASKAYLARAMETPLHYSVDHDKSEIVWRRAHVFVRRYARGIPTSNGTTLLETYEPLNDNAVFNHRVSRVPGRYKDWFKFSCKARLSRYWIIMHGSGRMARWSAHDAANQNAHIFAYYAKTGVAPPERSLVPLAPRCLQSCALIPGGPHGLAPG